MILGALSPVTPGQKWRLYFRDFFRDFSPFFTPTRAIVREFWTFRRPRERGPSLHNPSLSFFPFPFFFLLFPPPPSPFPPFPTLVKNCHFSEVAREGVSVGEPLANDVAPAVRQKSCGGLPRAGREAGSSWPFPRPLGRVPPAPRPRLAPARGAQDVDDDAFPPRLKMLTQRRADPPLQASTNNPGFRERLPRRRAT